MLTTHISHIRNMHTTYELTFNGPILIIRPSFGKTHRNQGARCDQCQRHQSWPHTHHRTCHHQGDATSFATLLGWCNHTLLSPTQTSQKPFLDPLHHHAHHHQHPSSWAWWNPWSPTSCPHRNLGHGWPLQPPHETCAPQWTQNMTLAHRPIFSHLHHYQSDEKPPLAHWSLDYSTWVILDWESYSIMSYWRRILIFHDED